MRRSKAKFVRPDDDADQQTFLLVRSGLVDQTRRFRLTSSSG
jgi:hypothetical protein